jgi:hypothetical protein
VALGVTAAALLGLMAGCGSGQVGGGPDGSPGDGVPSSDGRTAPPHRDAGGGGVDRGGGGDLLASPDAPVLPPGDAGAAEVQVQVNTRADVAAISPFIYGWNGVDPSQNAGLTLSRAGGNRWTAYNWENNASNAGSDYQFQNDNFLCQDQGCDQPGESVRREVSAAFQASESIIITVPMAGYVSHDKSPGGDVRGSGADYLAQRFRPIMAKKDGAFTLTPDPDDGAVYADEFVNWLDQTFPMARTDPARTILFSLDNEPDLWSSTHAEIHPDPVTYAELLQRSTDFAAAIKGVIPTATVLGPVSYGFNGYVTLQNAPDGNGRDFLEFFLDGMQTAEASAGTRLLDVLDLHWYPEATGGGRRITADDADPDIAAARVQAPRSLWDPTYRETSWIADYVNGPIQLLPMLRQKIADHYAGTALSLSEYNYGGGGDISGGIAQADVLGIFGREGLQAATLWPLSDQLAFFYGAFKAYRNFDGQGAKFGDVSVQAQTSDVERVSAYASLDAGSDQRLVLVLINRSTADVSVGVSIAHTVAFSRARTFQLTSAAADPKMGEPLTLSSQNAFVQTLPASSVTTVELLP